MTTLYCYSGEGTLNDSSGKELFETNAAFRKSIEKSLKYLGRSTPFPTLDPNDPSQTIPRTVMLGIGLVDALKLKEEAQAVHLGHSIGELVALYSAGMLMQEDALAIAVIMGKSMEKHKQGLMAVVPTNTSLPAGVFMASTLTTTDHTVAGDAQCIEQLIKEVNGTKLHTPSAYHTPLLHQASQELEESLKGFTLAKADRVFISSQTGQTETTFSTDQLANSWSHRVLFKEALAHVQENYQITKIVQVGAHPVFGDCVAHFNVPVEVTLIRDQPECLKVSKLVQVSNETLESIQETLTTFFKEELNIELDSTQTFASQGVKSKHLVQVTNVLNTKYQLGLKPTVFYRCPSPKALYTYLNKGEATNQQILSHDETTPIHITGMACQFPGAESLEEFWTKLVDGKCVLPTKPRKNEDVVVGYLQDSSAFDYAFFGISKAEAALMDPQQKLCLQVGYHALEDAGLDSLTLEAKNIGVFIGQWSQDHRVALQGSTSTFAPTGGSSGIIAARLAYLFNLTGPAWTVDTACSSSLVAVHQACNALRNGDCTYALAGGVNTILDTSFTNTMKSAGFLSPSWRCYTFDSRANGYVRSEGCGLVVLKLAEDTDQPYASILATAINQDGKSNGLTAPNPIAQENVYKQCYNKAGVEPKDIFAVETHGTGTKLGDPLEIGSLKAVLCPQRTTPCLLGAAKAQFGHTEGAAGMVGLIKAVLCASHRTWVGHKELENVNPLLELEDTLTIPTSNISMPEDAKIGISSFGFGGTNSHVLVGNAQPRTKFTPLQYFDPNPAFNDSALQVEHWESTDHLEPASSSSFCFLGVPCLNQVPGTYDGQSNVVYGVGDNLEEFTNHLPTFLKHDVRVWLVGNSAARALAATLAQEHPETRPCFIETNQWTNVLAELQSNHQELHVRYTPERQVLRLKPQPPPSASYTYQGTVLITGGTGGIGKKLAQHVKARGAENVVLLSRKPSTSPEIVQCDVTNELEVKALAERFPNPTMVFHLAGVLADASLLNLTKAQSDKVFAPKIQGAKNLVQYFPNTVLVGFSSVVALLGNVGQAHYGIANARMESVLGQHATPYCFRWGPIAHVGMAADHHTNISGMPSLDLEKGLRWMDALLNQGPSTHCICPMDWSKYNAFRSSALPNQPVHSTNTSSSTDLETVEHKLGTIVQGLLGFSVPVTDGLMDAGIDSLMAVELRKAVEQAFGRTIKSTLVFDYPTIRDMADFLTGGVPTWTPTASRPTQDAIAITGLATRFPGTSHTPTQFWDNLMEGKDCVTESTRWPKSLVTEDRDQPGCMYVAAGGFLDNIAAFDAQFFKMSALEARNTDPQQRIALEVAYEAMYNAGVTKTFQDTVGQDIGVYMGVCQYDGLFALDRENISTYTATGKYPSIVSNRISYLLGLKGPSMVIDTACSSSLVAVHLASQALRVGECAKAVAGGVNILSYPTAYVLTSKATMLSPTGRCHTFDASGDGYTRGEGAGAVFLEPLTTDKPVYAIIRGSATNQDGRTATLTAPNGPAQAACIHKALATAGLTPDDIDFVETHGTGTKLGDPIEVNTLTTLFDTQTRTSPIYLGGVKANMGHLEGAAGIIALIKAVLVLGHRTVPRNPQLKTLNPEITTSPNVVISSETEHLLTDKTLYAGISSFGFGGSNAHLVLEGVDKTQVQRPQKTWNHVDFPVDQYTEAETDVNPFIGTIEEQDGTLVSNVTWSDEVVAFLSDHRVGDVPLVPATCYVEMAAPLIHAAFGDTPYTLSNVQFKEILFLYTTPQVRITLTPATHKVCIESNTEGAWTLHAEMTVTPSISHTFEPTLDVEALQRTMTEEHTGEEVYATIGNQYQGEFRSLNHYWRNGNELLGKIVFDNTATPSYLRTCAWFDSVTHPGIMTLPDPSQLAYAAKAGSYAVPTTKRIRHDTVWARIRIDDKGESQVDMYGEDRQWVASLIGAKMGTFKNKKNNSVETKIESVIASLDRTRHFQPDYSNSPLCVRNKTVVITGASRGIGASIAVRLAREGANVCILARTMGDPFTRGTARYVEQQVNNQGGVGYAICTDLTREEEIEQAIHKVVQRFGGLDVLIHNASALWKIKTLDMDDKRFDRMYQTCIRSMVVTTGKCLKYLQLSDSPRILTIAPAGVVEPEWLRPHVQYTTCKISMGYLAQLVRTKYPNIQCTTIWPKRTIATQAIVANFPPELLNQCMTVSVMADASCYLVSNPITTLHHMDEDLVKQFITDDLGAYAIQPGNTTFPDDFMIDIDTHARTATVQSLPETSSTDLPHALVVGSGPRSLELAQALNVPHAQPTDAVPSSTNTVIFCGEQNVGEALADVDAEALDAAYHELAKAPFLYLRDHLAELGPKPKILYMLPNSASDVPQTIVEYIVRMYVAGHAVEFPDVTVLGLGKTTFTDVNACARVLQHGENGVLYEDTTTTEHGWYEDRCVTGTTSFEQHYATDAAVPCWNGCPPTSTNIPSPKIVNFETPQDMLAGLRSLTEETWFVSPNTRGVEGLLRTFVREKPDAPRVVLVQAESLEQKHVNQIHALLHAREFKVEHGILKTRQFEPIVSVPKNATTKSRKNVQYLITGGLGALGRLSANLLHQLGYRNILLASRSRSTVPDDWSYAWTPTVIKCDVSNRDDVKALFQIYPNIRGVLHCAGILQDGTVDGMDPTTFDTVAKPKVDGARWIDKYAKHLDFFVLYSSIAASFGNPGQAAYATANARLDQLARRRRVRGQPCVSMQWGAWQLNTGGMALTETLRRVQKAGWGVVNETWGMQLLKDVLTHDFPPVVLASPIDWSVLLDNYEQVPHEYEKYTYQLEENTDVTTLVETTYSEEDVRSLLKAVLLEITGMEFTPADMAQSLMDVALDSLSAVEFRNALNKTFANIEFTSTLVFDYPTFDAVHAFVMSKLANDNPIITDSAYSYSMSNDNLEAAKDFTIHHQELGSVRFLRPVDVRQLDVCTNVKIEAKAVGVYYGLKDKDKPPIGNGLNQPAILTLSKFLPNMTEDQLRPKLAKMGMMLVEYQPTGLLVVRVEHF